MEKHIAIIGAMDEEVAALSEGLELVVQKESSLLDLPVYQGKISGKQVLLVRCGVGKVHAALTTQYIIDRFNPAFIINSGVAGALNPKLRIGDLVLGTSSAQHDYDVSKFGYPRGFIPGLATGIFQGDPYLLEIANLGAQQVLPPDRIWQGLIVSGDQFISSVEQKENILSFFPEAMCAEMEGAAIAQVASLNKIPHLVMRTISDQADNTAPDDFDQYLLEVIPILNSIVHKLLAHLKN